MFYPLVYDAYYLHAQKVRRKIIEDFNNVFNQVDLILTPLLQVMHLLLEKK